MNKKHIEYNKKVQAALARCQSLARKAIASVKPPKGDCPTIKFFETQSGFMLGVECKCGVGGHALLEGQPFYMELGAEDHAYLSQLSFAMAKLAEYYWAREVAHVFPFYPGERAEDT